MKLRPSAIDKKLSEQGRDVKRYSMEVVHAMLQHQSIYSDYNRARVYEDIRDKWQTDGRFDVAIREKNIDQAMATEIITIGTHLAQDLRAWNPNISNELNVAGGDPLQLALLLEQATKWFKETACGNGNVPFADLGGAVERECSRCHDYYPKQEKRYWGSSSICAQCYPEFLEEKEKNKGSGSKIFILLIVLFLLWYFFTPDVRPVPASRDRKSESRVAETRQPESYNHPPRNPRSVPTSRDRKSESQVAETRQPSGYRHPQRKPRHEKDPRKRPGRKRTADGWVQTLD